MHVTVDHCLMGNIPFILGLRGPGYLSPLLAVLLLCRFYIRVLGMKQLPRPPFPFAGAWLQGGGLILHLIDDDPTIPRKDVRNWKVLILPDPCQLQQ